MTTVKIDEGLAFRQERPERRWLPTLLMHYQTIIGALIISILALEAAPYEPVWSFTWIALYILYWLVRKKLADFILRPQGGVSLQDLRLLALTFGITLFLGYLYFFTEYLHVPQRGETLWLLYLLAILLPILHSSTKQMLIVFMINAAAMVTLELAAIYLQPTTSTASLLSAITFVASKLLWLALLSAIMHILVRYLIDQMADVRLLHRVEEEFADIRDEEQQMEHLVNLIAKSFRYPHVNLFKWHRREGYAECIAGAGSHGRSLATRRLRVSDPKSMVVHAARYNRTYATNDVRNTRDMDHPEGFFLQSPEFPDTQAEMALPIRVSGSVEAVLDIQVPHQDYFIRNDVEILEVLAQHLGRMITRTRLLNYSKQIANTFLSGAFLSPSDLYIMLRHALEEALRQLEAHSIMLIERDPFTSKMRPLAFSGTVDHPEQLDWSPAQPGSLLDRLSQVKGPFFQDNVPAIERNDPLFQPSLHHQQIGQRTFAAREGIEARAIFILRGGDSVASSYADLGTGKVGGLLAAGRSIMRVRQSLDGLKKVMLGIKDGKENGVGREHGRGRNEDAIKPTLLGSDAEDPECDDECIGIMFFNFQQPQTFTEERKEIIATLAQYTASALRKDQALRRQIETQQNEIKQLQEYMSREQAKEIHERFKNRLAALIEFYIGPLTELDTLPPETLQVLRLANAALQAMHKDMGYLVATARGNQDLGLNLQVEMADLLKDIRAQLPERANLREEWAGDPSRVPAITTWHLKAFATEMLYNAQKYSRSDQITFRVEVLADRVSIIVRDNGVGFDTAKALSEHHGLESLQQRADMLKWQLSINSTPGKGSTITVTAPIAVQ